MPDSHTDRLNADIQALSAFNHQFPHQWSGPGRAAPCVHCGRASNEVIGGCLRRAIHARAEAPPRVREILDAVVRFEARRGITATRETS